QPPQSDTGAGGGVLAQGQRIQRRADPPQQRQPQHHQRQRGPDMHHRAVRKRTQHPEHDLIGGKGVGRQVQHQRGCRPGQRRNRDTRQDQHQRATARARQQQDQQDRDQRPRQRRQRQRRRPDRRQPGIERQ